MTTALIGYTGFVGGNIAAQHKFDDAFNSKNIADIARRSYDLVVCSGIPAAMWLANNNPEQDLANINALLDTLKTVNARRFVLVSTIAVYAQPVAGFDEDSEAFETQLAYGRHRRYAEEAIAAHFPQHCILRLPALFGRNLKKNFLYDLLNQEPAFIPQAKWQPLLDKLPPADAALLAAYYTLNPTTKMHAFDKPRAEADATRPRILDALKSANFTSLQFTHPESKYQFYDLANLWRDISIAIANDIPVLNLCSTPTTPREIAKKFFDLDLADSPAAPFLDYDMRTKHAALWNRDHYQYNREDIFTHLATFFKRNH